MRRVPVRDGSEESSHEAHVDARGRQPYACNKCTYMAARKCTLTIHMRAHTGVKPYACNKCTYRAARKSALTNHMRTHTGVKPYACNKCTYRAAQKCNLTRHMRTHTGVEPYAWPPLPPSMSSSSSSSFTEATRPKRHGRPENPSCPHCQSRSHPKRELCASNPDFEGDDANDIASYASGVGKSDQNRRRSFRSSSSRPVANKGKRKHRKATADGARSDGDLSEYSAPSVEPPLERESLASGDPDGGRGGEFQKSGGRGVKSYACEKCTYMAVAQTTLTKRMRCKHSTGSSSPAKAPTSKAKLEPVFKIHEFASAEESNVFAMFATSTS